MTNFFHFVFIFVFYFRFLFFPPMSTFLDSFTQETPSPVHGMRVGLNLRRSDRRCLAEINRSRDFPSLKTEE